jgi:hypothetical protein
MPFGNFGGLGLQPLSGIHPFMTLGTHLAFASVLYLGGATLFGYKPDWVSWALAAVASLLPDVDLPPVLNVNYFLTSVTTTL